MTAQDDCNRESQTCLNTKGNFTCIDKVSKKICPPGFKKNLYTQECEDINECEEIENVCAANEECINDPGGHTCVIRLAKIPLITHPTFTTPLVSVTPVYTEISSTSTTPSTTSTTTTSTTPRMREVPPPPPPLPQRPVPVIPRHPSPNVTRSPTPPWYVPPTQATRPPSVESRYNPPVQCPTGFEFSEQYNRCEGKLEHLESLAPKKVSTVGPATSFCLG